MIEVVDGVVRAVVVVVVVVVVVPPLQRGLALLGSVWTGCLVV